MKIQKFEKYNIDMNCDDIAEEHAKLILSEYLDKMSDGLTLEDVFRNVVDTDELEEDIEYMIKQALIELTYNIKNDVSKLRTKMEYDSDKYNL